MAEGRCSLLPCWNRSVRIANEIFLHLKGWVFAEVMLPQTQRCRCFLNEICWDFGLPLHRLHADVPGFQWLMITGHPVFGRIPIDDRSFGIASHHEPFWIINSPSLIRMIIVCGVSYWPLSRTMKHPEALLILNYYLPWKSLQCSFINRGPLLWTTTNHFYFKYPTLSNVIMHNQPA